MATVRSFKLITGEEVITRVEKETEEGYVFDRPMVVIMVPRHDGQGMGIQVMPYLMSNQDGTINVKYSSILGEIAPIDEGLEKEYIKQTSSIQMA